MSIVVLPPEMDADSKSFFLGVGIGSVLAVSAALLMYYIKRNPKRAKKMFVNSMRVEVRLLLSLAAELWDFFTDTNFLRNNILRVTPENKEAVSDLVTPWLVLFAVACVLSI